MRQPDPHQFERRADTLPPGSVHIWLLSPDVLTNPVVREAALSLLAPEEIDRARRFVFNPDRDAFLATRALARVVLSRYTRVPARALEFAISAAGKPELQVPLLDPRLRFNLSHTRTLVACAVVWERLVGIDVETLREEPFEIAERFFSRPEIEALNAMAPHERREGFFSLWTLKESFVKARGVGLSMALDSFSVALAPPRLLPWGAVRDEADRWHFVCASPTTVHKLAVCVHNDGPTVPTVTMDWLTPQHIAATAGPRA